MSNKKYKIGDYVFINNTTIIQIADIFEDSEDSIEYKIEYIWELHSNVKLNKVYHWRYPKYDPEYYVNHYKIKDIKKCKLLFIK